MFRASVLLATASLAAGLLTAPGAAFAADTTTSLTGPEMAAALKGVAGTTAPAELPGYAADVVATSTEKGVTQKGTAKFTVDPEHGRGAMEMAGGPFGTIGLYAQAGKGQWTRFISKPERDAVAMAGHPHARYSFLPDPKLTLDSWADDGLPAPSSVLTQDSRYAGSKTVHDDGGTDYAFTTADKTKVVFTVDTHGVLAGATISDSGIDAAFTWHYGAQTVTLPTAAQTVSQTFLQRAVAYLNMAGTVKAAAVNSAKVVEEKSGKKWVKVANLRKWTRAEVSVANSVQGVRVLVVADVKGGVRISAKNPFTGATAAWTVKASGKHAVAHKA